MNPDEMQELARAMEQLPGSKGIDFKDVRRLAQLLREQPEIGSIEMKGLFGTGVIITRTGASTAPMMAAPAPVPQLMLPAAAGAAAAPSPEAAPAAPAVTLKEVRSPMVGT